MKNYYTICNEKESPIAIFEKKLYARKFQRKRNGLPEDIQRTEKFPKLNSWFQIEQPKGKLRGYFLNLRDPSEFYAEEFSSKKKWS
ncbi:MAG: hypothetical protein ABFQ65_02325 [Nanoarchaeota archaeon]